MPVYLDRDPSSAGLPAPSKRKPSGEPFEWMPRRLHIGLINNMPDGALQATERQFLTLLDSAADNVVVRLSLFALPDIPRTGAGAQRISRFYSGIESLLDSHLDGLIVTGAEPRAPNLSDEPYWGSLTRVLDWAERNTHSTVWSCLAAHAAVLQMDGIRRRRLGDKRFGVFEYLRTSAHGLNAGAPASVTVPHSRWNDICENDLTDSGYQVLARTKDGVDSFVKQRKSLFVFFQGHPEYEVNTLMLEYRRDVGRYLRREKDTYPLIPQSYFDQDTAAAMAALRERALSHRSEEVLADFPTVAAEKRIANTWRSGAVLTYRNWLRYLCAEQERRSKERQCRVLPMVGEALLTGSSQGSELKLNSDPL